MITLGGVELPDDMEWVNEFDWNFRSSLVTRLEDGRALYTSEVRVGGQPMHLGGTFDIWVTRSTLLALRALEAQGGTYPLNYRGVTFTVAFDSGDTTALDVQRIRAAGPDPASTVNYRVVVRLIIL